MNIGLALLRIRAALGATQSEFSEFSGMSVSMISAVEKGTRVLSDSALEQLLTVLALSREELALIAIENLDDLKERNRTIAEIARKGILTAIEAQHSARKSLGMLT